MDDRTMLTLAAKAAGIEIEYWTEDSSGEVPVAVLSNGDFWQPLYLNTHTDCMGDALRLAVKLQMEITIWNKVANARARGYAEWAQESGEDGASATRRAVVRAVAELGKKL